MKATIALLPGDGIGPEVIEPTKALLETIARHCNYDWHFNTGLIGGIAIDQQGSPLPEETLQICKTADAVLLGAVGGPKWSDPEAKIRPEQGLLKLRSAMNVFANLRPIKPEPQLFKQSPIKSERLKETDMLIVRELTGGAYFGAKVEGNDYASDLCAYTQTEIERVVRVAAKLAQKRRGKLTLVDKANVLATSRLWRKITTDIVNKEFSDLEFDIELVDAAAMHLINEPSRFDVIVTENLFGDILTDEASMLAGSLGMLPSASIGEGNNGLYEPIHGSAPDIAGKDLANPFASFLSAAMMLELSLSLPQESSAIRKAISVCLQHKQCTPDIGGTLSTQQAGEAVIKKVSELL